MASDSSESSTVVGNTKRPQISPSIHWCFTFNNYTTDTLNEVLEVCQDSSIVRQYVFQEETGITGTPHLQGYLAFAVKKRPKGLFPPGIHWEKCRDIRAAIAYCHKEETRTGHVFTNIKFGRPLVKVTKDMLLDWQAVLADQVEEPEDPIFGRTIYWVWEPDGNVGKTVMSKYFCDNRKAIIVGGKAADIKFGIAAYIEKNREGPELVIVDVPRCVEHISWDGIECAKNGIFFSGKYESGMVRFNCPHVICFANVPPPREKLSSDRWRVFRIKQGTLMDD